MVLNSVTNDGFSLETDSRAGPHSFGADSVSTMVHYVPLSQVSSSQAEHALLNLQPLRDWAQNFDIDIASL